MYYIIITTNLSYYYFDTHWCMVYGVWYIKITNQENEIDESFATYDLKGLFGCCFQELFFCF